MNGIKDYLDVLLRHEIVRRYALINSFDGILTVLGIVFAEFFSHIDDPRLVILPGLGAAVALFVSGIWSAYFAERAEVKRSMQDLEAHLMKKLSGTRFAQRRKKMTWLIAFVNGFSPFISALIILVPFFFVPAVAMADAYLLSLILVAVLLFSLGALAGKVARESLLKQGLTMLFAGFIIGGIFLVLTYFGVL